MPGKTPLAIFGAAMLLISSSSGAWAYASETATPSDSSIAQPNAAALRTMDATQQSAMKSGLTQAQANVKDAAKSCAIAQSIVVTKPNDSRIYTYNANNQLVEGSPTAKTSNCLTAAQLKTATSAQANGGPVYNANIPQVILTPGRPSSSSGGTPTNLYIQATFSGGYATSFGANTTPDVYLKAVGPADFEWFQNADNCTGGKRGVWPDYSYHGSCPHHNLGTYYSYTGILTFPSAGNTTTQVYWNIAYSLNNTCRNGC